AARMERPAAHLSERIVIGSYPRKTATRRTIAIRSAGATTKASAEMGQHRPGHRLGLVEIGEMAGASDGLRVALAIDAGDELLRVARRQDAVGVAPQHQGRRLDQRQAPLELGVAERPEGA